MSNFMATLPRPVNTYHSAPYDRISKQHGFHGKGKTVLITGGAGGIGYNMSQAFAAGGVARIAIVARSAKPLEEAKAKLEAEYPSVKVLTFQASITDYTRMQEVLQELGTMDVLILNAAVAHRRVDATEVTLEEVEDAFNINTIATFNLTKAYLALPTPTSGSKTVLCISTAACSMLASNRVGYGSSKAAGVQIMQQFAHQFRNDENISFFSFHPGAFYTPGVAANFAKMDVKWDHEDLPAHFALWLAGPESRFLNGRFVWANWDVDELIALKEKMEKEDRFLTIGLIQ
jgi:NAD(P)-dependent dehydrogenase (short-subunit alcohol dehydrogenase family)